MLSMNDIGLFNYLDKCDKEDETVWKIAQAVMNGEHKVSVDYPLTAAGRKKLNKILDEAGYRDIFVRRH